MTRRMGWTTLLLLMLVPGLFAQAPAADPADPAAAAHLPDNAPSSPDEITLYEKVTPEQAEAALAEARRLAKVAGEAVGMQLRELETDHFLIFTDWDVRENKFLQTNMEGAYRAVALQFNVPSRENIFVGKLSVFMFAKENDYLRFLREIVGAELNGTLGVFVPQPNGQGFMAMWKPAAVPNSGPKAMDDARRQWAHTLTHEFTHAFVSRYKSNAHIPRWLNEGIAEVVAYSQFPDRDVYTFARLVAMRGDDVSLVFDDENMPGGFYYPVMMTMVEALAREDRKAFIEMFDLIKKGTDPERALELAFKTDYDGLQRGWRIYAKGLK